MTPRILAKPAEPETDPLGFNTTALAPQPKRRRLRVGNHRVVHTIDDGELAVRAVHAGHRSTVHETRPPLTHRQNIQHPSSTGTTKGADSIESAPS
ncbi:type II toxin-antitoxin system RelE family toxin [Streptomyces huasconensis]